jgi:hypothetical protein
MAVVDGPLVLAGSLPSVAVVAKSTKALSAISRTGVGGSADFRKWALGCLIAPQGSIVLDRSKIPSSLAVHRVWVPEHDSDLRRPVVYVSDRRRRTIGAVLIMVSVVAALAVVVTTSTFWLAFVPLLTAWEGVAYAGGGQTGFYEVSDDGGLGEYLGRSRPDIGSMRPSKPWR